jgi:hypothetical protein
MRRFGAATILLLSTMPTLAAELPTRKAGLWEIRMNNASMAVHQCVDAATDRMTISGASPTAQRACPEPDVQRSGDTWTIDSTCTFKDKTFKDKTFKSHMVITGSFDSAFTSTTTEESDLYVVPGVKVTTKTDAKWLGPCAADQKPGDIMMENGMKLNLMEMMKQGDWQIFAPLSQ